MQRDYIANRMGEGGAGISYTEFSYTLLQGYDYLHLFDKYNCTLQLGGSDQWGNCLSGVDLIRRARGAETHVMTNNLVINQTTGKKFGKSEAGAVWLDESKTSVYQLYQFWLNVDDGGVEYYMKIYTEMTKEQIDEVMAEFHDRPHRRAAQKSLAYEVTKLVHGENRANSVQKLSEVLFGSGEYVDLGIDDFKELAGELKTLDIKVGNSLVDALVNGELASSKGEARRFLQDNAVYINGSQISLDKTTVDEDDFLHNHMILRRGKNKTVLLRKD